MHRLYLSKTNYYRLNILEGSSIDNPDQRITSDVSSLVEQYSGILTDLVVTPFTVTYYTYDAYSRAGWIGPSGMYALFLVSTVVNKLLMKPLVKITVEREKKEGDFRFKHLQIRCNAESLAFHGSAAFEQSKVNNKLSEVCGAQQSLYYRNYVIDLSVNTFAYIGAIASYLVISVPIFSGAYDNLDGPELSQKISENSFVCIYLIFQLTVLVQLTGTVASIAGSTHRVCELIEELIGYQNSDKQSLETDNTKQQDEVGGGDAAPIISVVVESPTKEYIRDLSADTLVEFRGFGLCPPATATLQPSTLIHDLNMDIKRGRNLMVMGPSSSGKSSLLRTIRGLWAPTRGTIITNRNLNYGFFYLPQKPFFTNGSLRDQLSYPLLVVRELIDEAQDTDIINLLDLTGLTGLVDRCGDLDTEPTWSWYDILSPGEQQRLAFARLLYHKPILAVLDEATSAVSLDVEKRLYESCLERKITLLSVGHRNSLKQFHQQVLYLSGENGGWELQDLPSPDQTSSQD